MARERRWLQWGGRGGGGDASGGSLQIELGQQREGAQEGRQQTELGR